MPRREFGDMLGTIDKPLAAVPDPQPEPTPAPAKARKATATPPKATKKAAKPAKTNTSAAAAGGVGYDKLERKDTRLHERQISELTDLARQLNRQRQGEGHRLTENTLIRLGIDLLLQRSGDLHGTTEAELAASLGLK